MDPVLVRIPYNRFGCRTYNQFLIQFGSRVNLYTAFILFGAQAVVSHYGTFLGEAFHMFSLLTQERFRDKQREVSVLCPRFLKHLIELLLHLFPYSVTIRFDNHTSAHGRLFSQVGFHYKIIIPLTIVISPLDIISYVFFNLDAKLIKKSW